MFIKIFETDSSSSLMRFGDSNYRAVIKNENGIYRGLWQGQVLIESTDNNPTELLRMTRKLSKSLIATQNNISNWGSLPDPD
jgi:hypothetical protein